MKFMSKRLQLGTILLCAIPAFAQPVIPPIIDSGAIQQRRIEEERRRREAEKAPPDTSEPITQEVPEAPAIAPGAEKVRFFVKAIEFTPSEILSSSELEELAKDFRDKEVSLADLQTLATGINELYRSKKVATARAVIPPQDVTQGTVRIQLIEGHIGQITVQGNATTRERYITNRLQVKPTELVDLTRLERAMVRFNRTNDPQLKAELKPGQSFGTTDVKVDVTEPGRHDLRLIVDDYGNETTGRTRATLAYLNRSLFGFRDDLMISDSEAEGQSSQAISYGFPINRWGGRLNVYYYYDETEIIDGLLEPLNISGESTAWMMLIRQPAYIGPRSQFDVLAGARTRDSKNWIDSEFLDGTETRDVNLGFELQVFGASDYWLASYTYYAGHAEQVESRSMAIRRGLLRYSHNWGDGYSFQGGLTWQSTSDEALPSSELFFIGGQGSVRGYVNGAYSGDTGRVVNLELRHPITSWVMGSHKVTASGVFHLDDGYVEPFRPPNSSFSDSEHITGIGWGLNLYFDRSVQANLMYTYGLSDAPEALQDDAFRFQVVFSFF
jgi:hemolysin activation/secretion protein